MDSKVFALILVGLVILGVVGGIFAFGTLAHTTSGTPTTATQVPACASNYSNVTMTGFQVWASTKVITSVTIVSGDTSHLTITYLTDSSYPTNDVVITSSTTQTAAISVTYLTDTMASWGTSQSSSPVYRCQTGGQKTITFTVSYYPPKPLLSIDGTTSAGCGHNTNSCTATMTTTNPNDVIIVYTTESLDLQTSCTFSLSDQAGLTWKLRASSAGRNDGYTNGYRDQLAEFWAINAKPLVSDVINETISGCASTQYGGEYNGLLAFGVSGANTNAPFDPNPSLPSSANGFGNLPSVAVSTTNSNDMVIGIAQQSSFGILSPGPGFTILIPGIACAEYKTAGMPTSNLQVTFGDTATYYWEAIADAISPA